jgi:hypothetical protein
MDGAFWEISEVEPITDVGWQMITSCDYGENDDAEFAMETWDR